MIDNQFDQIYNEHRKSVVRKSVHFRVKQLENEIRKGQDLLLQFIPEEQKKQVEMKFHSRMVEIVK